jgi:uncharacterized membrane protein YdjX (TVP38/TMEM64 family)
MRGSFRRRLLFGLLLAAGVGAFLLFTPLRSIVTQLTAFLADPERARDWLAARAPWSALVYVGVTALQVVLAPAPGELACVLGGLAFGGPAGSLWATLGLTLGSVINLLLARWFGWAFLQPLEIWFRRPQWRTKAAGLGPGAVFLLFLIPGAPKDSFCYLFGLIRYPMGRFLAASSLGRLPGTLVLCFQADGFFRGDLAAVLLAGTLGLFLLGPFWYYRRQWLKLLGITGSPSSKESLP